MSRKIAFLLAIDFFPLAEVGVVIPLCFLFPARIQDFLLGYPDTQKAEEAY